MEVDVLKAQIVRPSLRTPWGFTLQGGADTGTQVVIHRVTPGSPAAKIGLKAYDVITEVGDVSTETMTCQDVLDLIGQYGDTIIVTVERRATGGIPNNPVVTPDDPDSQRTRSYQTYDMTGAKPAPRPRHQMVHSEVPGSPTIADLPSPTIPAEPGSEWVPVGYIPSTVSSRPARQEPQQRDKFYQTYDLTGKPTNQPTGPQHNYEFRTVTARPFNQPPGKRNVPMPPQPTPIYDTPSPPPQQAHHSQAHIQLSGNPGPGNHQTYQPHYNPEEDNPYDLSSGQSRSFNVIKGLMENEEPMAGDSALPGPRSVAQERWLMEQAEKRQSASPRVKVFMPQQYNSPLGMYSPKNVVETFQSQAETMMDRNNPSSDL